MKNEIKLFEDQNVRVQWDEEQEKWFFSIVDIVAILTQSVELFLLLMLLPAY